MTGIGEAREFAERQLLVERPPGEEMPTFREENLQPDAVLTLAEAATWIRAAYGRGYRDGLEGTEAPLAPREFAAALVVDLPEC